MRLVDVDVLAQKLKEYNAQTSKIRWLQILLESAPVVYEQTEWIPIEKELPNERCGRVLVSMPNGEVTTALYSEYSKMWYIGDFCGVGDADPIAWMPLPQVYIKEKVNG